MEFRGTQGPGRRRQRRRCGTRSTQRQTRSSCGWVRGGRSDGERMGALGHPFPDTSTHLVSTQGNVRRTLVVARSRVRACGRGGSSILSRRQSPSVATPSGPLERYFGEGTRSSLREAHGRGRSSTQPRSLKRHAPRWVSEQRLSWDSCRSASGDLGTPGFWVARLDAQQRCGISVSRLRCSASQLRLRVARPTAAAGSHGSRGGESSLVTRPQWASSLIRPRVFS